MALPKNIRNYKAYLEKKKRGPVKTFFHITKNENVPAIEKKGLLANHPNANINSAFQPFRKHGSTGGGVWVTTEPTAFPVYGTTIGGRSGDASARADALTTFKIDVPKAELPKMLAVQDPYGKNILRKGNDPKAIEPFHTWYGIDVPTTAFLNDMKPAWLKNLGYVEERSPIHPILDTRSDINELRGSWGISPGVEDAVLLRHLSQGDLRDYSGLTGHGHGFGTYDKSPQRFVEDYIDRNRPITYRLPVFPVAAHPYRVARLQGAADDAKYIKMFARPGVIEPNELKRYSVNFIPAFDWTDKYRGYAKPGESIQGRRSYEFAPGAISRGMGAGLPPIKDRNFDWTKYKQAIAAGEAPMYAAFEGRPKAILDWDNIRHHNGRGYGPEIRFGTPRLAYGAISRGMPENEFAEARARRAGRKAAAELIRRKRNESRKYLSRELGRLPTAEELDAWTRAGIFNDIETGDIDASASLGRWADKVNWDIADRISEELFKRIGK